MKKQVLIPLLAVATILVLAIIYCSIVIVLWINADSAYRTDDWASAKRELTNLLSINPLPFGPISRGNCLIRLASVNTNLNDFEAARNNILESVPISKDSPYWYLAHSCYQCGRIDEAEQAMKSFHEHSAEYNRPDLLEPDLIFLQAMIDLTRDARKEACSELQNYLSRQEPSESCLEDDDVLRAPILLLMLGTSLNDEKAVSAAREELSKISEAKWPSQFASFLEGKGDKQALITAADTDIKKTQLHCFTGLKSWFENDSAQAKSEFEWVIQNGVKSIPEYTLCKELLKRAA